jgi:hypothetical protein
MRNKTPMRNQVVIRKLVAELVGFPEGGIVVQPPLGFDKHIGINWPESMKMTEEQRAGWEMAKRRLEAEFPGWLFYYS